MKLRVLALLLGLLAVAGLGTAAAASGRHVLDEPTVRYDRVSGDHPTVIQKIIVHGAGCMNAEDSVALRLDNYDPNDNRAVYHCATP